MRLRNTIADFFLSRCWAILLLVVVCVLVGQLLESGVVFGVEPEKESGQVAFGLKQRVPWKKSRVIGSPEPPAPYRLRRVFPGIDIPNLIALSAIPDSQCLLAVDHQREWGGPSRVLQFTDRQDANETKLFLSRPEIIYGLAFHPRFSENGYVYIGCNGFSDTLSAKATKVLRFRVQQDSDNTYFCEESSEQLVIEWKSNGHNGGDLVFGNDGMLYVSAGDGTSDSDANRTGQDLSSIPGSLLRIDVDHADANANYGIPADNPFLNEPNARPEIWAYGLRNPWRVSFDKLSGQLWVGNNGQDLWESVYLIEKGANYGWSIKESNHPFHTNQSSGPISISEATVEHHHSEARSLTGGHVYRGELKDLVGSYIYGDFSTGNIWAVRHNGIRLESQQLIAQSRVQITGFGFDSQDELLVADHQGGIYRLERNEQEWIDSFPKRLSETGLYQNVVKQVAEEGVIPYSVISPLWSDGAQKQRWLAVPNDKTIGYKSRGSWDFPDGTVLVKSFSMAQKNTGQLRRIETRLMNKNNGEWFGYSYRWNKDQTDAYLVAAEGTDEILPWAEGVADADVEWRYPSRTECMVCHSRAANFVLGLSTEQMNRLQQYSSDSNGKVTAPQIETLAHIGMFGDEIDLNLEDADCLVDPSDVEAGIAERARSYLHSNCSSCHMNAGGGNARIKLTKFVPLEKTSLVDSEPLHGRLETPGAELLLQGNAKLSLLFLRMSRRGGGQMPPLASKIVDPTGTRLIRDWINSMAPSSSDATEQ